MKDGRQKLLSGWKYALYYRDAIVLNPRSDPNLAEKMVNVLVEEGVPRRLIRRIPQEFGFLDFEAHMDNPFDPKSVIISVCTIFHKDKSCGSVKMMEILRIPLDKEERSKLFHLMMDPTIWTVTDSGRSRIIVNSPDQ
jgi:hypothetical protein